MELFHEESVSRKNPRPGEIAYRLYLIATVIFTVFALVALATVGIWANAVVGYGLIILFALLALACFLLKDRQVIEYDYSFVNGSFTVSRIINNRTRKELLTTEVTEWHSFTPYKAEQFERVREGASVIKAYCNADETLYCAVYSSDGDKKVLVFEPSEKMADCISKFGKFSR